MDELAAAFIRPPEAPGDRYLNRELSWLQWDLRCLQLAEDESWPLLERVRMCSIVAATLDEFFMIRVAGLEGQRAAGLAVRSIDGRTPAAVLADIREGVIALRARQDALWKDVLTPALRAEGIEICSFEACTDAERQELGDWFDRNVYPVLTPLAVGPGQPFPYISGLSLSLGFVAHDPVTGEERFARVKVPEGLARFVRVGHGPGTRLVPLEEVIAHLSDRLFPGIEIVEQSLFRVTRDADFELSDEADDLLEAVELELRRRRFGDAVRLEVSEGMSAGMRERLCTGLGVTDAQVYETAGLMDMADLGEIADLDRPELKHEPWLPVTRARLADATGPGDLFARIRSDDLLVHLPYESFSTSVEAFVRAAAKDPGVVGVKTTVYRTSDDTALLPALIEAVERSKQAVCLVELKARFDERRNVEWSRAMEQAGVHVVHGFRDLKIHAKTTLVIRREGGVLRRYAHIGTGNYNGRTARLYEDLGLFTDDEEITADVADLFNHMTGFGRPQQFRKLLVAPFNLRTRVIDHIRAVADAAVAGKPASIRMKVNSLTDAAIIEELYRASQAGARIDIIARSICSLRPGVPGMSERIHVRSIAGRFLEHSRLLAFEAGEDAKYFLGSADLMPRNLDHRIEVLTPVEDPRLQHEISTIFETLLGDRTQAWVLEPDGSWIRLRPERRGTKRGSHAVLMRRARLRARPRGRRTPRSV
jgi:polyphosphate kinase